MRSISTLLLVALPFALAANRGPRAHNNIARSSNKTCSSSSKSNNPDFGGISNWDFFTGADPTQGQVSYQGQSDAQQKGLAYVQSNNVSVIRVDGWTKLGQRQNRDSVRISSKKTYNGGLFVADFEAMPTGCGTWVCLHPLSHFLMT
jgi:hypothetical protein